MAKYVFRLFYDFEKAEIWLNEKARRGWMADSFAMGVFKFSEGTPGEYIYRVELLPHWAASAANQPYLRFLEGTGVEVVSKWVKWVMFRRKACEGAFDVYTDNDSRIRHYRGVSRFLFPFCFVEWLAALAAAYLFITTLNSVDAAPGEPVLHLIVFLFAVFVGVAIFRAAWRARKKYMLLKKEQGLCE